MDDSFPTFIQNDNHEFTGETVSHELALDMRIADPDIDQVRVTLRNGWIISIKEIFGTNGLIYECLLQTEKGSMIFATFDSSGTGHNACRVVKPLDII